MIGKIITVGLLTLSLTACGAGGNQWWQAQTGDPNILPRSPCACLPLKTRVYGADQWRALTEVKQS